MRRYYFTDHSQLIIEIQQCRIRVAINKICDCNTDFDINTLTELFSKYTSYKKYKGYFYTVIPLTNLGFMYCEYDQRKNPILKKYRK